MRTPKVFAVAALVASIVACSSAESGPAASTETDGSTTADASGQDAKDGAAASMDGADGGWDAGADASDGAADDAALRDVSLEDGPPADAPAFDAAADAPAPDAAADAPAFDGAGDASALDGAGDAPSTADNPPVPAGWVLLPQSDVTPEMSAWAVGILNDPATYPMFSTTTMVFGTLTVLARVEWHPPDFQNGVVHRGVTLYEAAG